MITRKPKTRIITGCNNCPFLLHKRSGTPYCNIDEEIKIHNSNEMKGTALVPLTPDDCPLKTQPIIVTYES